MARNVQAQPGLNRSRKGTHPVDIVLLLPVELHDALEVGVNHGAEVELLLTDLFLLVLSANEVLGDASLDDRPAHPFAGRPGRSGPEVTHGTSRNMAAGAGLAEHGIRGNHAGALGLLWHHHLRHHRSNRHHRGSLASMGFRAEPVSPLASVGSGTGPTLST